MPSTKGYGSRHINDRRTNPGKVTSGKVTASAYGPQEPMGKITLPVSKSGMKKRKGY